MMRVSVGLFMTLLTVQMFGMPAWQNRLMIIPLCLMVMFSLLRLTPLTPDPTFMVESMTLVARALVFPPFLTLIL